MRQIHINENLSNKTLRGPHRQSYFGNCNLEGTKFVGDWRGTDYIGNTGGPDWTQADTYLSYWRGNDLEGAKFPTDIGCYHHEPIMEMFRVAFIKEPNLVHKVIMSTTYNFLKNLYAQERHREACICTVFANALRETTNKDEIIDAFYKTVTSYPQWIEYIDGFIRDGKPTTPSVRPSKIPIGLADGEQIELDKDALPTLSRPNDRYELARKLETQLEAKTSKKPFLFVNAIDPPIVRYMKNKDEWFKFYDIHQGKWVEIHYKGY